ncbi:Fc.00g009850.m01.CDS01 [Cosmosporella sp. VM-42]
MWMTIDTRERPYVCHCSQRFSRRDLLVRHQRLNSSSACERQSSVQESDADVSQEDPKIRDEMPSVPSGDHIHLQTDQTTTSRDVELESGMSHQRGEPDSTGIASSQTGPASSETVCDLMLRESSGLDGVEFEFLWDNAQPYSDFLPVSFFDTDFSLADISQQYAGQPRNAESNTNLVNQSLGINEGEQLQPEGLSVGVQETLASRLPSLEPMERQRPSDLATLHSTTDNQAFSGSDQSGSRPWRISSVEFSSISQEFIALGDILPCSFTIPSRHTLSRYLEGYFRGFHDHMPFCHTSTFSAASLTPELLLALTAVGALYRFEHAKGYEIYNAARSVINWRMGQHSGLALTRLTSTSPGYAGLGSIGDPRAPGSPSSQGMECDFTAPEDKIKLRLLQALVVLMALTSWGDHAVVRDSLAMASQVAMLAREIGIAYKERPVSSKISWEEWTALEERRRTLFVAYMLPNLQCIAFNVPPMILNQEVAIELPSSGAEWKARDAVEWSRARNIAVDSQPPFRQALGELFSGTPIHHQQPVSAFGNYALIHGLVQQIFLARNAACLVDSTDSLPIEFVKKMESALRAWQESWEATSESTLDPSSPKGPLGFNATGLLRLAYIRLNANIAPNRQLLGCNSQGIARAFLKGISSVCQRSAHLDRAILQCIHALSIPVRVGIAWVARTQTLNWSIQHSLCNLECAFLLTYWLQTITQVIETSGIKELRPDERKLLDMVASLVRETDLADTLDASQSDSARVRNLTVSSMRLWAETFKGFHVFEIVHAIGAGLSIVADRLEELCSKANN